MIEKNNYFIFNPRKEHKINEQVRLVIKDEMEKEFVHFKVIDPGEEYHLKRDEIIKKHQMFRYKYQRKIEGKWTDYIEYKFLYDEQKNRHGLKYIYYPPIGNENNEYLIVVFQGIKEVDRKNYYNYIKTLANVNVSKLYIKDDYGSDELTQTSYYLGPNKSLKIANKVDKLIEKTRKKLKIKKENVICAGSSKGGFASLYFAYRMGYGYVVSGGPQIRLGTYLTKGKIDGDQLGILPPIMKYLTGEITKENVEWADQILYKMISKSKYSPKVYLHVGKDEPHYQYHVKYFMDWVEKFDKHENIKLDLSNYSTHKELAIYFPEFLTNSIDSIIKK